MIIHCAEYWKDVKLMIDNFKQGIFPITQGCTHSKNCVKCRRAEP